MHTTNQTAQQLTIDFGNDFLKYHEDNPQVYEKFRDITQRTIAKGFKHYSAKAIFELCRWHTGVEGNDEFKVNNNYTPLYARLFEKEFPLYAGFFRKRESKYDVENF
jgi:hypothetical protein